MRIQAGGDIGESVDAGGAQLHANGRAGLRKASWRLLPLIALGYGTAFMDRVNISYAALQMNRDLHFSNTVYGFGAGLFFLSYAACEIPSNLMLYRMGARRWLSRIMVTWGVIAMAMIFVRTPMQFYAARFLLGMAEAGFFPGIIFYIFSWYPPRVRARAITGFYVAFPLSTVVMGSLAGVLLNLNGRLALTGWQWLFLVEALPAVMLGVAFYLLLPDGPADARWLTVAERTAVLAAVAPAQPAHGKPEPIGPALRDRRVWLIGFFFLCVQACGYGYSFSAPAIVQKVTGLSTTSTGLLLAGIGLLGAAAMVGTSVFSDRSGRRHLWVLPWCAVGVVGFLASGLTMRPWLVISALALVFASYTGMQGPLWAIPGAFLTGRSAAAGVAAINMIGIVGGFLGPYWMGYERDLTGGYQRGLLSMAVPMGVALMIMLYLGREDGRQEPGPGSREVREHPRMR